MDIVYNWHITENCNYSCQYCFAQWGKNNELWKDSKKVDATLSEIKEFGHSPFGHGHSIQNIRINFAGGEPLLLGDKLINIVKKANHSGFKTSIITNASLLERYLHIVNHIEMLGVSIDSLDARTNQTIGRSTRNGQVISFETLSNAIAKARAVNPNLKIKFNVVVNQHNFNESLIPKLQSLQPYKIKVLKELSAGNNISKTTDNMFSHFIDLNECRRPNVYIEDNDAMTHSYLMLDPMGRLYQNGCANKYTYSKPLHEIGLNVAIKSIKFNQQSFFDRYKELCHEA